MLTESNMLLLGLLAENDGLHWPVRGLKMTARSVCYERRRDFLQRGHRWSSGGLTANARKSSQRRFELLVAKGDVIAFGPAGRTTGARLTEDCDDRLRHELGIADYDQALGGLDALYHRRGDPDGFDGLGVGREGFPAWTSEATLTGIPWGRDEDRDCYIMLYEDLAPLLWRALVRSNSSVLGHTWYAMTKEGYELASRRARAGQTRQFPPSIGGGDDALYAYYVEQRREAVEAIEAAAPQNRQEIGDCPLPACPVLRKYISPGSAAADDDHAAR